MKKLFILNILFISFFTYCGQEKGNYTIEIIDGIKHINNFSPQWVDSIKVALEYVQTFGDIEAVDENYQFYHAFDMAKDSEGNIYIVDEGNFRVQKYNPEGKYLATYGRRGLGPSEFLSFGSIDIDKDDNIYFGDPGINGVKVLSQEGKEIRRFRLKKGINFIRLSENGKIVNGRLNRRIQGRAYYSSNTTPIVHIYELDGTFIREFCNPKDFEKENMIAATAAGNRMSQVVDSDNNIYIAFSTQNRIEKYSIEGELLFKMDRVLNYDVVELGTVNTFPNYITIDIGVDGKNRIWALTCTKQRVLENPNSVASYEFEIFNSDGILLGEIPYPDIKTSMGFRIYDDYIYLVKLYEVTEYKIVEK